VTFGTAWDYDNEQLTYELLRDGGSTPVNTTNIKSNFWTLPRGTLTDTAVPGGSHTYRVRIRDPLGNASLSPVSNSVTVKAGSNVAPTSSFTATTAGLSVSVDASASTDPDGSIVSYAWTYGDGATASGVTATHTYAADGTYTITLKVTDNAGATNSVQKQITVTAAGAGAAYSTDAFGRTVSGGWGQADVGGAWSVSGTLSRWSVSGGAGHVSLDPGVGGTATVPIAAKTDTELSGTVWTDKAATGGGEYISLVARRISASVDYRGKIRLAPDGTVVASLSRMASGTETALGASVTVPGLTMVAGDKLRVRTQAVGTSPTALRLKVWKLGTTEPSAWLMTASDSTAGWQTAGGFALDAYLSSSATNAPTVFSLDDLWVGPSRP
jgi:PKD repeat protein